MSRCFVLRLVTSASRLGVGLLLLGVVLCAGCKRSTAVTDSESTKNAVSQEKGDSEELPFKSLSGEEVRSAGGKPVALPASFPTDVAVYPGATPVMTAVGEKELRVRLSTTDAPEKVLAFYREQLKVQGWKTTVDRPKLSMLEGEKEGRKLTVIVSDNSNEASVDLIVSKTRASSD